MASFGSSGSLDLALSTLIVIGANLGIGITRLLVGWQTLEARRLAVASLINRSLVAIVLAFLLTWTTELFSRIALPQELKVALIHLGFNVLAMLLGLVTSSMLIKLATWAVRLQPSSIERPFGPHYITPGAIDCCQLAAGSSLARSCTPPRLSEPCSMTSGQQYRAMTKN